MDVRVSRDRRLDVAKRKSTLGPASATFWLLLSRTVCCHNHTQQPPGRDRQRMGRIRTGGGHEKPRLSHWASLGLVRRAVVAQLSVGQHQASKTWNLRF